MNLEVANIDCDLPGNLDSAGFVMKLHLTLQIYLAMHRFKATKRLH